MNVVFNLSFSPVYSRGKVLSLIMAAKVLERNRTCFLLQMTVGNYFLKILIL